MKNIPDVKLGIIAGSTDWLPSDLAEGLRMRLVKAYRAEYGENNDGSEIYECPVCITDNEVNIRRAMRDLTKAGCNAICIYFGNYGPESAGTLLARNFEGPVMMFGAAEEGGPPYMKERKDSLSGFLNACYALSLRKTDVYVPPRPIGTMEQCVEMIHDFIPIARTLMAVRDLKIISFSPRPSSYLAACAPDHLLYDIGVEISEYSELELLNSFQKHDGDQRIEKTVAEMEAELGEDGNKNPEILPELARYEITVRDWIRSHKGDRKYIALTSTCWPAFPVNFGFVPCYVNSRITGAGTPVACEVDVYGAVSEYIGQCVSNDAVAILNMNNNVPEQIYDERIRGKRFNGKEYQLSDLFIGYHCGVTCSGKLKSCSMECHFVNHQLIGEEQSRGTIQGQMEEGLVTIFRLQGGTDGKLRAYAAQGQILPVSADTYGGYGIIAVPEMERFIRNVVIEKHFPNHTTVVSGHHGSKLTGVLRQLGITEIYYNQPKNMPYEGEDVFENEWY